MFFWRKGMRSEIRFRNLPINYCQIYLHHHNSFNLSRYLGKHRPQGPIQISGYKYSVNCDRILVSPDFLIVYQWEKFTEASHVYRIAFHIPYVLFLYRDRVVLFVFSRTKWHDHVHGRNKYYYFGILIDNKYHKIKMAFNNRKSVFELTQNI